MGRLTDQEMIQFLMLNSSRGPAVMSPRTQIDRVGYQRRMKHVLELEENIDLLQQEVTDPVSYTHLDVYKRQGCDKFFVKLKLYFSKEMMIFKSYPWVCQAIIKLP